MFLVPPITFGSVRSMPQQTGNDETGWQGEVLLVPSTSLNNQNAKITVL